ncbi:hypothetical protein HXX76_010647 [Chlamydomonas incerta]|uniref:Wax synthase domain-containing protein n=1 Tax=Chlamydomonas incerta TaxID=51695 RepID=A0A835VUJ4_CHLIN|nr:hypothetical protein HXX76_010647 [Chlamydomonas incerta]|eukprot:KAG2429867.1 hypothetical protein HXX76_010647 [Chlamydomonas incerta]
MTVPQITAVIFLPIFPNPPADACTAAAAGERKGRLHDNAGSAASLARRWVAKLVGLGLVVAAITLCGDSLPRVLLHYLYALGLYFFVGFLMDGPGAVAVEALGLQLVPTFDAPWLSTSLADFWGRRWNITTSSVLRTLVYDTIAEGRLLAPKARQKTEQQQQHPAVAAAPAAARHAHEAAAPAACSGLQPDKRLGQPLAARPSEASGHESDAASVRASESGDTSSSLSGSSIMLKSGAAEHHRHPGAGASHKRPVACPAAEDEPAALAAPAAHAPLPSKQPPCAPLVTSSNAGVWAPGSLLRRTLAVHAACLASGLCHEYAIWHVSGLGWHWKWTLFFYMQAPLMTLEGFGRRWLRRRGLRVPRLLANILTLAVLEATAYPLFFGFVETDTDLARRVVAALSLSYQEVLQPLRPLLSSAAAALAGGGAGGVDL